MNSPSLPVTLVSILLALVFFSSLSSTNAETNLAETICNETQNYTNCLEVLKSDPETEYAKDLNDLAKIALELALSNAKESLDLINCMINDAYGTDQEVLEECAFWYNAVVGSFRSSLTGLEEDALTANYDAKIAGDNAYYCEKEMVLKKRVIASVSERNSQVKLYSNICDAITNRL